MYLKTQENVVLEDFHSRNSEDPLEVFRSCSKIVLGVLPYLAAAVLIFISMGLTANPTEEQYIEAKAWKVECQKYFRFREPRVIFYRDYTPMVWCSIESRKILKGITPFDYKKDTR
jgi:hypothetical protein